MTEIVHRAPLGGDVVTPCCHRTPFELPLDDRMTVTDADVTCGVEQEAVAQPCSHCTSFRTVEPGAGTCAADAPIEMCRRFEAGMCPVALPDLGDVVAPGAWTAQTDMTGRDVLADLEAARRLLAPRQRLVVATSDVADQIRAAIADDPQYARTDVEVSPYVPPGKVFVVPLEDGA
ncbi:MAG: hypothetical protein ACTHMS_23575 [Jatrophihabitans sp.]|uniref:hypothetical protein n=1 Tax=Jatrophihabitans sp. TaxID=1932789 RepID=UPI003F7D46DE